jgi:hypothetical protein
VGNTVLERLETGMRLISGDVREDDKGRVGQFSNRRPERACSPDVSNWDAY